VKWRENHLQNINKSYILKKLFLQMIMAKLTGTKMNMTTVWQGDIAVPVTVVRAAEGADFSPVTAGMRVKVSGITKGHGFAGVVKRHGFGGGPKTHGQKNRFRAPGSIGNTAAQRVIKGRRMAGRMGGERVTVKNILVAEVRPETREILLRGAVPGAKRGTVYIVTL
jgi:large subunit ribosomal protein L3